MSIETLIHNGEYSYSNSLSLFQNIFPKAKTPKGVRHIIRIKYGDDILAETIYNLLISSQKIDCLFLQKIDNISIPIEKDCYEQSFQFIDYID